MLTALVASATVVAGGVPAASASGTSLSGLTSFGHMAVDGANGHVFVDGSLVMDRESNLLAFGAILRNTGLAGSDDQILEGGRTTAAFGAPRE